jgi:hypothetical protein
LQGFLDQQRKSELDMHTDKAHENFFSDFHSYDEITSFLDGLTAHHSNLVKKFQLGSTSEGRPIYAWTVHKKTKKSKQKTNTNAVSSWLENIADRLFDWLEDTLDLSRFDLDDDHDVDFHQLHESGIHISKKKNKKKNRKPMEIIINGGQHGREWISPVSSFYFTCLC